ncbi:E3 ubiquitin-protein ligase AIRP2-like isoform X2 [Dioscorea cayenensis subsp. rotundata]|uniref:E3 ubiquitin-protein ligase AIRP2-like isoform X2 n=1 Tax=Dioscorea cayennensis subsp. rotundata TaxID=55577 RepID=A0AB40BWY9_DIOCR|nr:E3 ubiquitin-protein ligase AIRP2-like isoform X2 [Dioscorea cayenensis subsp. rotundata]
MRKSKFKTSLKSLEADIRRANTLASGYPREEDGAYIQMRLSYNLVAGLFPSFVQKTDTQLTGALGLIRVLIYKVFVDGKTTVYVHERKASIKQFYGIIFPSLMQLQGGLTTSEQRKQREMYLKKYRKVDETEENKLSEVDMKREKECGICMEPKAKIALPTCMHTMCMKCYQDWQSRSRSCPFCRIDLQIVRPSDLWIYIDKHDAVDMAMITKQNTNRLFVFTDKLPLIVPDPILLSHNSHAR